MNEIEELRELLREVHGAMKDLRTLMKQADTMIADLEVAADVAIADRIKVAVQEGMNAHQAAIRDAILDGEDMVYKRFGEIAEILMSEHRTSKGATIKEMVERWVEEKDAPIPKQHPLYDAP